MPNMFSFDFGSLAARVSNVLFLGAHCDDIEIGCGATVLRLLEVNPRIEVTWVVFSADGVRASEARESAEAFLAQAETSHILIESFRERYFPYVAADIKEDFERSRSQHRSRHRVHPLRPRTCTRTIGCCRELAWHTFRDSLLLEYEIPKLEGDLGQPNFFVHLDKRLCEEKVGYLAKFFPSQRDKHWFSDDTFWSLMRIRGLESKAPSGHAEAFHCRKLVSG